MDLYYLEGVLCSVAMLNVCRIAAINRFLGDLLSGTVEAK